MKRLLFIDVAMERGGAEVSLEKIINVLSGDYSTYLLKNETSQIIFDSKLTVSMNARLSRKIMTQKKSYITGFFTIIELLICGWRVKGEYDCILSNTFKSHIIGLGMILKSRRREWMIFERDMYENKIIKNFKRFIYGFADKIIFNSNYSRIKYGSPKKSAVIYNIVEHSETKNEKDGRTFLFIGEETYEKGFDRSVKLIDMLYTVFPDVKMKVLSEKKSYGSYVNVEKNRNYIEYAGYTDPTEYYKRGSYLILLNRRKETFSRAVAEAMGYGVIPFILKGNGMDDYAVNNHNAFVFDDYDEFSVFESVLYEIENGFRVYMSDNCIETVKRMFSKESAKKNLSEIIGQGVR